MTREEKRAANLAYRAANREAINAQKRAHYAANRERLLAEKLEYTAAHREEKQAYDKAIYQANAEKKKAQARANYHAHREREIARGRLYHRTHRAELTAKDRVYRKAHRAAHPEIYDAKNNRRRAHRVAAPVNDLTPTQWQAIKAAYGHRCVYCGRQMQRLTMDHILPLSKGGSHTYTNVVPACQTCNSRKKDGPPLAPVQPLLLLP